MRDRKWLMLSETWGLRARVKTAVAEEDHRIEGGFLFLMCERLESIWTTTEKG